MHKKFKNEVIKNISDRVEYSEKLRKKRRVELHSNFRHLFSCSTSEKNDLKQLMKNVTNDKNPDLQLEAARKLREMTTKGSLVGYLIDQGLSQIVKEKLLCANKSPELQLEGIWICANISIDHSEEIIEKLLHISLMHLIFTPESLEGALWAFINVAGENVSTRDSLLQAKLMLFIENLSFSQFNSKNHQLLSSLLFSLTKFSGISNEVASQILSLVMNNLSADQSIIYNSIFTVHHLLNDAGNSKIVVVSGMPQKLMEMLVSTKTTCESLIFQVLQQMLDIIDEKTFDKMIKIIENLLVSEIRPSKYKTEYLKMFEFLEAVSSHPRDLWRRILKFEVIKKIPFRIYDDNFPPHGIKLKILSNLITRGDTDDILQLGSSVVFEEFSRKMHPKLEIDEIRRILCIIDTMLSKDESFPSSLKVLFEKSGGKDNINLWMFHDDLETAELAFELMKKFWPMDVDPDLNEAVDLNDSFVFDRTSPLSTSFLEELASTSSSLK